MKIALSLLSGVSYGGTTYFRNLIPALAKTDRINEYHIFVQKGNSLFRNINQDNFVFHECSSCTHSAFIRLIWEQFILPKELKKRKIDIMFTAKNANILFAGCKTIVSVRNMEPLCYKNYKNHWMLNVFSWLRKELTRISIKKADRIIAVSESTRKYLERFSPDVSKKIDVIYNGNPVTSDSLDTGAGNEKSDFLLSVSKFVAYANQFNLIEGYALLDRRKKDLPPLWLAGGVHDTAYFQKIRKLIMERDLTEKIKILGLISHERLIKLYSNASAFLFPSILEACPQTLIEAMACGVPIAASKVPPMPEICERAAIYFDPLDKNDIAEKIDLLLTDEGLRNSLKKASLERCNFFDWDKTASELVNVFEKVYKYEHSVSY